MTSDLQESYKPAAKKTYCLTISNVLEVKSEEFYSSCGCFYGI